MNHTNLFMRAASGLLPRAPPLFLAEQLKPKLGTLLFLLLLTTAPPSHFRALVLLQCPGEGHGTSPCVLGEVTNGTSYLIAEAVEIAVF